MRAICQNQQTRLEDHFRLQGHKSHAAEDDYDEPQNQNSFSYLPMLSYQLSEGNTYSSGPHFSPCSLSLSAVSCASAGLYCSVPVKLFCIKQRARDGGPKFTPSECINVFEDKQGREVLKSLGLIRKEREGEQMVFYMHTKAGWPNWPAVLINLTRIGQPEGTEVREGVFWGKARSLHSYAEGSRLFMGL